MAHLFELLFLASDAMAQAGGAAQPKGPGLVEVLAMPAGIILIMYFFMIRPQQKKAKEHQNLLTNLKRGDEVVTTGGIIGKIATVNEQFVSLQVANNTQIKVLKQYVAGMTKAPATEAAPAKKPAPAKA